jgi:hypothetical protein
MKTLDFQRESAIFGVWCLRRSENVELIGYA